ncbi:MAG: hydrogen peroxide-inducible genes activator [Rhodobacteraceae bacterium]|nr:hydrogen peroxide-inducible genes activator [Paracoccaceae bacterium]
MRPSPSLRQLRYFVAVAETGNFRRAAERCGVSQPSLSLQVAGLEEILGARLISRGRGKIAPTVVGREVLTRARRILDETNALVDLAADIATGLTGMVRLGTSPALGPYFLPGAVSALHRAHPDLKLYVREAPPRRLLQELERGEHDMILTQLPVAGADLQAVRLFREPLLLVVPVRHPLAKREAVREADLAGLSLLSMGPDYVLHEQVAALCANVGAHLEQAYEGTSLDALRTMTAMEMGICLLPALYVASEVARGPGDVRAVPFAGGRVARSVGLVTRRRGGNERAFQRLTEVFRDVARSRGADGLRAES